MQKLLESVHQAMDEAAREVMAIYADPTRFDTQHKDDDSPLTAADLAAHRCLCRHLEAATPEIPVLSEESAEVPSEERRRWARCWVVDPLDGTKEFLKRNDEFTLNVALVEDGRVVLGVVDAPALGRRYFAAEGVGAWRRDGAAATEERLSVASPPAEGRAWRVVGSRSHPGPALQAFVDRLPAAEVVPMGSSLKLCLVAEGSADLYPRLGPTCEWDTAAAQCVVEQAGGRVLDAATGEPLRYNQRDTLLNPWFIACAERHPAWRLPDTE
ncbi:3'(2'),5'-bisphosphate nucleotidase CysQ [Alkalilimnicola ehrlichii MLHE-1]|uniref:3'(2'),5'-bisphosphate nucleotidase CysQ n=1 Tax=Alkalilimnicola ehrlichii (strain ATCC BAA-1101 / DSM 17681 / MLHE-1) TaxID=187272 RepID=Q0A654_ALKEH|nr:3'(2'),5'-bisphosphate nucleotidase CysQ [Alkalilimnicola ehrlichii]ABI57683.1 3'(2'),5'-bisphosphate nucleotidase [Alkalilimnicola ehrlichii MLHE-1]